MSTHLFIDVYLGEQGFELNEAEIQDLVKSLKHLDNDDDGPDVEDISYKIQDIVDDEDWHIRPKVQRLDDNGCRWVRVCGVSKGQCCNLPLTAGTKFCKYHNIVMGNWKLD